MSHFQGAAGERKAIAPSRKPRTALHALDGYLTSQSVWLANYAERAPRRLARWNRAYRTDGQFPGETAE
jgi:hypothetical protein